MNEYYLDEDDIEDVLEAKEKYDKFKFELIDVLLNNDRLDNFSKLKYIEKNLLFGYTDEIPREFRNKIEEYSEMMMLGYDSIMPASSFYTTMLETDKERERFFNEVISSEKCFYIIKNF